MKAATCLSQFAGTIYFVVLAGITLTWGLVNHTWK